MAAKSAAQTDLRPLIVFFSVSICPMSRDCLLGERSMAAGRLSSRSEWKEKGGVRESTEGKEVTSED